MKKKKKVTRKKNVLYVGYNRRFVEASYHIFLVHVFDLFLLSSVRQIGHVTIPVSPIVMVSNTYSVYPLLIILRII